ncbi:hypothetical protein R3P38DRAFT_3005255 [Favolaschia claudopus]|uniref:Uncharacterized protein n=1 Tax=Favolaschia claudopus TaxID=2862362 RepID=A0AAW0AKE7_9AGAR
MPEFQVLAAFGHRVKQALKKIFQKPKKWPQGYLVVFPRTWAEGTARKPHETFSIDVGDYTDSLEPIPVKVSEYDEEKLPTTAPGRYLIGQKLAPGPVHVAIRGKHLALCAGHHALVCRLGLEGSILVMTRSDYEEVTSVCVPGNNPNKSKAARLRSFLVPERFVEPGARLKDEDFKVNILAAVVMETHAIVVIDYSRIAQIHVVSSARKFEKADLRPGSEMWRDRLWAKWGGAPDWVYETDAALASLDEWHASVLSSEQRTPILDVLNTSDSFASGLGQHMASDLLFELAVHPDMPSFDLCADAALYARFRNHLPNFMRTFVSASYLERCGLAANSSNPFIFNEHSHNNFIRGFVKVYRKAKVHVPANLYNSYQSQGLLDPDHIIGTPYLQPWDPAGYTYKVAPVRFLPDKNNNRYTIICAQPPETWESAHTQEAPFDDVSDAGFSSTLGPASFVEVLRNKLDPEEIARLRQGKRGRPRKPQRTGNRGRPKNPLTLKVKRRIEAIPLSLPRYTSTVDEKENEPPESDEGEALEPQPRYRTRSTRSRYPL